MTRARREHQRDEQADVRISRLCAFDQQLGFLDRQHAVTALTGAGYPHLWPTTDEVRVGGPFEAGAKARELGMDRPWRSAEVEAGLRVVTEVLGDE